MANLRDYTTPPRARVDVSSLLSPPEMKRSESFSSTISALRSIESYGSDCSKHTMDKPSGSQAAVGHAYNTPPFSPNFQHSKHDVDVSSGEGVRDPQVFVATDDVSSTASRDYPLFPREGEVVDEAANNDIAIDAHMKSVEYSNLLHKPAREEYQLVASFRSTAFDEYRKDPRRWYRQEREYDQRYGKPTGVQKKHAAKKLAPAPSSHRKEKAVAIPRLPPRAPRAPKRTPKARTHDTMDIDARTMETTPAPHPKPAKVTKTEDTNFESITDYSPPLKTLDEPGCKGLKAEWKNPGQFYIRNEEEAKFLHEDELKLAATLRLHCAVYLTSKRRIFQARLAALRNGKDFRKTDAQQACRIDVNKASRLWGAYEKIGWFDPKHFQKYL